MPIQNVDARQQSLVIYSSLRIATGVVLFDFQAANDAEYSREVLDFVILDQNKNPLQLPRSKNRGNALVVPATVELNSAGEGTPGWGVDSASVVPVAGDPGFDVMHVNALIVVRSPVTDILRVQFQANIVADGE